MLGCMDDAKPLGVLDSLKSLGTGRLAAMAGVAGAMLLLLAFVALRGGGGGGMALLYSDIDLKEASQIVDQLDRAHIAHDVQGDGSRILVPIAEVSRARLLLAKEGLPSGGSIGYEIFDRGDGMTASQFQQGINQTRALEGELSRTIRSISGVRAARVHLVLPKREPFARDRQEAQASVVLSMAGPARMDPEGIQAVLNLVAAAVPGLRPQGIAVIDSRGNLLARPGESLGLAAALQTSEAMRRATELRLSRGVEEMLERSLGAGHVRAEASIEMDFDQVHETLERFDPDGQVMRSQQTTNATTRTTEANQTVSVQNNLPNADAGAPPAGSQDQRQEETNNYEIGKTTRTTVHDQPQLRRISLAVMVDQMEVRGDDGHVTYRDRTPEELGRIAALARSVIGFDEKRGDRVEIVSMRFAGLDEAGETAAPGLWGLPIGKPDLLRLGQTGLVSLIAIVALLFVLRPMVVRLTSPAIGAGAATALLATAPGQVADAGFAALTGPAGSVRMIEDDAMVSLDNIQGSVRASSIRQVAEMVEKHPEASLAIVRGWMVEGAS